MAGPLYCTVHTVHSAQQCLVYQSAHCTVPSALCTVHSAGRGWGKPFLAAGSRAAVPCAGLSWAADSSPSCWRCDWGSEASQLVPGCARGESVTSLQSIQLVPFNESKSVWKCKQNHSAVIQSVRRNFEVSVNSSQLKKLLLCLANISCWQLTTFWICLQFVSKCIWLAQTCSWLAQTFQDFLIPFGMSLYCWLSSLMMYVIWPANVLNYQTEF